MSTWTARSPEQRGLLNPSFCATLFWYAASGYQGESSRGMPFELSFILLPMVLHRETRESLPKTSTTSLAVWLEQDPLVRSRIVDRARMLVKHTKEALAFGGQYDFLRFDRGAVAANGDWKKKVAKTLQDSSDEVRECAKRAEFVGKWLAKSGDHFTVMALIGVQP